jgi:capsid protein
LLEAWKMFRAKREWMAKNWCQPIYEMWLTEAVARGRVYAPGFFNDPAIRAAYCAADWNGPAQGQLDPLKEANAAKVRVDECFSTRAKETAELTGLNYEKSIKVRIREEQERRDNGLVLLATPSQEKGGNEDDKDDE